MLAGTLGAAPRAFSPLDLIELQISYTTLLARFYRPVTPRALADGARTGVGAELVRRGIARATLPYPPAQLDAGRGGDYVSGLVLRSLARYGARLDPHALATAAVAGELAALHDPYSVIFQPQQFKKFNAFLGNGAFGGIGAVLSFDTRSGTAPVDRVLPGAPAETAGLRAGDAIAAVDEKPVSGLGAAGVRDALRGRIGSTVHLTIVRDGARTVLAIVRARVTDPAVRTARFGDTGYVALSRFGDRAGSDVAAAVRGLVAAGARSIVFDLRGNGGGYGDEATAVASAFLRGGVVFTTRERGTPPREARATGDPAFTGPLAVLVDGDTASAAEIVAGAIQDDRAGRLIGTRTFGKGVVQSVFPLPDGSALKVTTARYTTPNGRDIDRSGIVPDDVVPQPAGAAAGDPATDRQLDAALRTLGGGAAPAASPAP